MWQLNSLLFSGIGDVIQALSRRGFYVTDLEDTVVTEHMLQKPFKPVGILGQYLYPGEMLNVFMYSWSFIFTMDESFQSSDRIQSSQV